MDAPKLSDETFLTMLLKKVLKTKLERNYGIEAVNVQPLN